MKNVVIDDILISARELDKLADTGFNGEYDDGCLCLFGIVRDCAYRIICAAQEEQARQARKYGMKEERKVQSESE